MAQRLLISEWAEFEKVYKKAFTDEPPRCGEAIVIVEKLNGEIVGFGIVRMYTVLDSFWVAPKVRGPGVLTKLLTGVLEQLPKLSSCIAFTSNPRFAKLFTLLGMEHLTDVAILKWTRKKES